MKKKKTFSASDCRAKLVESLFSSLREMFGNEAAVVLVGSDFWKECVEELKKLKNGKEACRFYIGIVSVQSVVS